LTPYELVLARWLIAVSTVAFILGVGAIIVFFLGSVF
jgi:hypothetical protein